LYYMMTVGKIALLHKENTPEICHYIIHTGKCSLETTCYSILFNGYNEYIGQDYGGYPI